MISAGEQLALNNALREVRDAVNKYLTIKLDSSEWPTRLTEIDRSPEVEIRLDSDSGINIDFTIRLYGHLDD